MHHRIRAPAVAYTAGLVVATMLAACGPWMTGQQPPAAARDATHAVHDAILDSLAGRTGAALLVVATETWTPGAAQTSVMVERATARPRTTAALLADFQERAGVASRLGPPAQVRSSVSLAEQAALEPTAGGDAVAFWRTFFERHPGSPGWIRITNAGFAADGGTAVAAAELRCGVGCGWGALYVLSAGAAGWQISDELMLWVQ